MFDSQFASLDQREEQFLIFYFAFKKAYPNFARLFPEVNEYMDLVYKAGLTPDQKDKVDSLTNNSINDYPELVVNPNKVEINGVLYRQCPDNVKVKSGFEIRSSIAKDEKMPLILPVESGTIYTNIFYITDYWENTNRAPFFDPKPIGERRLPKANEKYPYLTVSDFLEDVLIRVPNINTMDDAFFGTYIKESSYRYLLPLKDTFFHYFTIQDLQGKVGGQPMIEFRESFTDNVKVTLRIPIQGNRYIEYSRQYIENGEIRPEQNKGMLIERNFSIGLLSNIQYDDVKDAYYRAYIMSEFEDKNNYNLTFRNGSSAISVADPVVRNDSDSRYFSYKSYIIEQQLFDSIKVACEEYCGVLIPIMQRKFGTDCFTFAIDFGTTNSHIEYTVNNGASVPFSVSPQNAMVKLWGYLDDQYKYIFDYDTLPSVIGEDNLYKFPMRTALCFASTTNWNKAVYPLGHTNIPFPYEKKSGYGYDRIKTDLKWSNDPDNTQRIKSFIESLFIMLRTKVLLCNGNLPNTKIVWFYPISMVENRYNSFCDVWTKSYEKYFGGDKRNVIPMTESVAPYEHYRSAEANVGNIVTIDIGGGTTDIVLAKDGNVQNITSFHFAADSVFGDPYISNRSSASVNKVLEQYESKIKAVLQDNSLNELLDIFEQHKKSRISSNIASFYFSLKGNKDIVKRRLSENVDFNNMLLLDSNYKIVFVLFYSAIIYHLAHIMKAKSLEMPRHIAFSGNGSKVIRILTSSNSTLEKFTKKIFEEIYGEKYPVDGLTILQNENNPKEVTCKGGLANPTYQEYENMAQMRMVYKAVQLNGEAFVNGDTYASIDDAYIRRTVEEAKSFVKFVFDLNQKYSYKNNFDSSEISLEIAKKECFRDLETFTKNGLKIKRQEVSDNDVIEETMFFYPLNGMLNALISAIYKKNNQKV